MASQNADNGRTSAVHGGTGVTATPANSFPERHRRPSQESGGLFAGLMSQKRNSTDNAAAARKMSFTEQSVHTPGFLGKLWNGYTKGN